MRIAIVEDHALMREFLKNYISEDEHLQVVGEASTGREAVEVIVRSNPDIVVIDIGLPDIDGFEVIERIRELRTPSKFLVLSSCCTPYLEFRMEQTGVNGFIDKVRQSLWAISHAIRELGRNAAYFPPGFLEMRRMRRLDPLGFHKILSKRQITVLTLVAHGMSDMMVSEKLNIALSTVQAHRSDIMQKLGIHSQNALLNFAISNGFSLGRMPCSNAREAGPIT